ncbi:polysaccharide deacetylase [Sphingobium sp. Leaf26]|uniref:glycosyltransferase n=1 Tax=Sphingobium sp. Leaf26 TaxID=1735693 RepID=UPI0006F6E486|nr:glycosyltransferase [Sphingobium sp. Leaf26]KQN04241.1 polysaccharide deacetylase [Sphingobium sp. Leaf26]
MHRPIFYDASGRRRRFTLPALFMMLFAIMLAAVAFAITIVDVPIPPAVPLRMERPRAEGIGQKLGHLSANLRASFAHWLPHGGSAAAAHPVTAAFYVPWDDASRAALRQHVNHIDWIAPALLSVTGPAHRLQLTNDSNFAAILHAAHRRPKIFPVVQNVANDAWDGQGTATLLHDRHARTTFLNQLLPSLKALHAAGVVFDFEALPAAAQRDYLSFLRQAAPALRDQHLRLTLTVPVDDKSWDLSRYGHVADRLFLMDYDQHYIGDKAGPIAAQPWFVQRLRAALTVVPAAKTIVAIGNYAYDWTDGAASADTLSIEDAWLSAHDSGAPIRFDPASGNASFDYQQDGRVHHVWMLDAASAWNQIRAAHMTGTGGIALWRLGSEDPGFWSALRQRDMTPPAAMGKLTSFNSVDVEGNGEILRIDDVPTIGRRTIAMGSGRTAGLITDEHFVSLPTPYVIRRTGYRPHAVALTFDDGPDPVWTPPILNILRKAHVPATFFVIGENAMMHPGLLRQIVAQGSEIGNHSYTHPNLAQVWDRGVSLELNSTQRLVEAYTGHAMRLFRAPYFGDAEPTTADEIGPALEAQQAGYLNVGLHVDPGDWTRPGTEAIVARTIAQVEAGGADRSAQIILLHDSGGDRAQTVAALPRIIGALKARGYRFVPVSTLAGLTPAQVMPAVRGADLTAVRIDVAIFLILAAIAVTLKWLFFAVILFGIGRALMLAGLALGSRLPRNRIAPPAIEPDLFVSVIIPAFNEAKVIEASVRRVLSSDQVGLEVIVVDDGSTDGTSRIVADAFAGDSRVQLLTLANAGKAAALNRALDLARAPIIVALDADTQFEPLTIARLARWFADPAVGAVAGNAMVGNRINLVTRWQAVEYVTAQNLERRALARFGAITVVPGAVGAWRRAALDAVGGYPLDTLAEDQDLTIAVQRAGWRIAYDTEAVAWTEAPESFRALSKQRFRWAFGTLQCLWKHRGIWREGKPAGLAWVGLPQAWLFQIAFAMVSPIIDLALVVSALDTALRVHQHGWAQTQSDVLRMALYWIAFTAIDIACGAVAYRLEPREKRYPALLLVAQRFIYRQIMYSVVIRAVGTAILGPWVGWGKLERSGRVQSTDVPHGASTARSHAT